MVCRGPSASNKRFHSRGAGHFGGNATVEKNTLTFEGEENEECKIILLLSGIVDMAEKAEVVVRA